jgi:hypothetical protein
MPGCFADNFQEAFECGSKESVGLNVRKGLPTQQDLDVVDGVGNISQPVLGPVVH